MEEINEKELDALNIWRRILLADKPMDPNKVSDETVYALHLLIESSGHVVSKYVQILYAEADNTICFLNGIVGIISVLLVYGLTHPVSGPVFFGLIGYVIYPVMFISLLVHIATLQQLWIAARYVYKGKHITKKYTEFCEVIDTRYQAFIAKSIKKCIDSS